MAAKKQESRSFSQVEIPKIDWAGFQLPQASSELDTWLTLHATPIKPPRWLSIEKLPTLFWQDAKKVENPLHLLEWLRRFGPSLPPPSKDNAHPLKQWADRLLADLPAALAWDLFEQWQKGRVDRAGQWVQDIFLHWADPDTAELLARSIRGSADRRQHRRVNTGLELLAQLPLDVSIQAWQGLLLKARTASVRQKSQLAWYEMFSKHDRDPNELGDDWIPDGDFDAQGILCLSYGPRQFSMILSDNGSTEIRDEKGKLRKSEPKPAKKDDAGRAESALRRFRKAKRLAKATQNIQIARLEAALVDQRTWPIVRWKKIFFGNPIVRPIAQRLLWELGLSTEKKAVRLADDLTLADINDDEINSSENTLISLWHPLHQPDSQRSPWREIWDDYELIAPFDQIDRPAYTLAESELTENVLQRFFGAQVSSDVLSWHLADRGWRSRPGPTLGGSMAMLRDFAAHQVTAILHHEPFYWADRQMAAVNVALQTVAFVPWDWKTDDSIVGTESHQWMVMGEVSPMAISEVLRDIEDLFRSGTST